MCEELIHTEEYEGFEIRLFFAPEDLSPRGEFMTESGEDDEELLSKIEDGTYMWFQAHVTASKNGVELGHDYLGGCCYESAEAFMHPDGYWPDMRATAVAEARQVIARLTEA